MTAAVTVLVVSTANAGLARALLPQTPHVAGGAGHLYLFYKTNGFENFAFYDPVDGSPLIASHSFESLSSADAWVREDIARREAAA